MWTLMEMRIDDRYPVKHQIVQKEEKTHKGENTQGRKKKAQKTESVRDISTKSTEVGETNKSQRKVALTGLAQ